MDKDRTKTTARYSVGRRAFAAGLVAAAAAVLGGVSTSGRAAAQQAPPPVTTERVASAESDAGNLVADAVRAAGGATLAFVPAAAFKTGATVPRPATGEQAARLVEPADDAVVVLTLRGAQILAALERSVSFAPQKSAGFLQVSGLRFRYNPERAGGQRVTSVTVGGQPLAAATTYTVATTRPLANGQQGYFQIWEKSQITGDTGKTLATALRDLAAARGGSLTAAVEGRITSAAPSGK